MFWPLIPQFVCNCLFYWALYFNPIINIDLVVKEVRRLETQVLWLTLPRFRGTLTASLPAELWGEGKRTSCFPPLVNKVLLCASEATARSPPSSHGSRDWRPRAWLTRWLHLPPSRLPHRDGRLSPWRLAGTPGLRRTHSGSQSPLALTSVIDKRLPGRVGAQGQACPQSRVGKQEKMLS